MIQLYSINFKYYDFNKYSVQVAIMTKMTTILAVLALVASVLPLSLPVQAAGITDVYVVSVGVSDYAPLLPGNISMNASIRATDLPCSNVEVRFYARNGTEQALLVSDIFVAGPVQNTSATLVQGYWNSTFPAPEILKSYSVFVQVLVAADTNWTNDLGGATGEVNWKSPLMTVINMTGAPKSYIGDDYQITLTVANYGNLVFNSIVDIPVYRGVDLVATTTINCTVGCSVAVGASVPVVATISKNTTKDFLAGVSTLLAGLETLNISLVVDFMDKAPNVSVTAISFDPASNVVKGTQLVSITASLKNTGNKDAADMLVHFLYDTIVIQECLNTINVSIGGTNTTTCVWRTPDSLLNKLYTINVTPDPYGVPLKGSLEKELAVLPTPKFLLGISGMTYNPSTLVTKENVGETQDLTIVATVTNFGDMDLWDGIMNLDTVQGPILVNKSVNITAGGQVDVTFKYAVSTPENDTVLKMTAIIMKNDKSFSLSKNITVPGDVDRPEFNLSALTITPASESERGLWIEIKATIDNVGDATGIDIPLTFRAGTTVLDTRTVASLPAGTSRDVFVAYLLSMNQTLGNIDLSVGIDNTAVYKNLTYKVIELKTPNLKLEFGKDKNGKVQSFSGSAADGKSKTYTVTVLVSNIGAADAKNVTLLLKDSKGNVLGSMSQMGVKTGKNLTVTFTIKVKAGTSTKLHVDATYDGLHGIAGHDKGLSSTSDPANSPTVKVTKTTPGFEAVVLIGAVAVALVVLSRRKKN
jgi:hypothetical protein